MTTNYDIQQRIIDLTVGDLVQIMENIASGRKVDNDDLVVGIDNICAFFGGISRPTLQRMRHDGRLKNCIWQSNHVVVLSKQKFYEQFNS